MQANSVPQPLAQPEIFRAVNDPSALETAKVVEQKSRFFLLHFYTGWECLELTEDGVTVAQDQRGRGKGKPEMMPRIERIDCRGGAANSRNSSDVQPRIRECEEKGGICFQHGSAALGKWRNLWNVQKNEATNATYFVEPWTRGTKDPKTKRINWRTDERQLIEFRRFMRDSGAVPPMHPDVYNAMLDRENEEYSRLIKESRGEQSEAVKKQRGIIDAMAKAWETERARSAGNDGEELVSVPIPDEPDEPTEAERRANERKAKAAK